MKSTNKIICLIFLIPIVLIALVFGIVANQNNSRITMHENYIEFDEPEYWTDRCVELLDEIFNKERQQVKENLKIKDEFDFNYYFSSLVAIENFTIDIDLRIYSKNEGECKKLFDYYIDTIKNRFSNDDLIGELTENVDFYNTSYENMNPTLTNNEIWIKLENDTFTYKGVL